MERIYRTSRFSSLYDYHDIYSTILKNLLKWIRFSFQFSPQILFFFLEKKRNVILTVKIRAGTGVFLSMLIMESKLGRWRSRAPTKNNLQTVKWNKYWPYSLYWIWSITSIILLLHKHWQVKWFHWIVLHLFYHKHYRTLCVYFVSRHLVQLDLQNQENNTW